MYKVDDGIRLEKLEALFDKEETELIKKVGDITYPTGHELRKIAEEIGGKWVFLGNGNYDLINMPFLDGVFIIERPFANIENKTYNDHRIAFRGDSLTGIEEHLEKFSLELLQRERVYCKNDFLQYETLDTNNTEWINETVKLFEK